MNPSDNDMPGASSARGSGGPGLREHHPEDVRGVRAPLRHGGRHETAWRNLEVSIEGVDPIDPRVPHLVRRTGTRDGPRRRIVAGIELQRLASDVEGLLRIR